MPALHQRRRQPQLIRAALKENFPGVKFSVRLTSTPVAPRFTSAGRWPRRPGRHQITSPSRCHVRRLIDLKSYVTGELDGEAVHFGADYVFTSRELSTPSASGFVLRAALSSAPTATPPVLQPLLRGHLR